MNIEQSKKLSIIDFLDKENVTLKKKKGNAYWYLSPFRDEKTASFKVSKKENLWYDYAIKEGGDLVELVSVCITNNPFPMPLPTLRPRVLPLWIRQSRPLSQPRNTRQPR